MWSDRGVRRVIYFSSSGGGGSMINYHGSLINDYYGGYRARGVAIFGIEQ